MAVVDFSKPVVIPPTDEVPMAVALPVPQDPQQEGEFTARDLAIPYLKIGQKTSDGVDENPGMIGQFVFADGVLLGKSLVVVFLKMAKHYQEKTEYGDPALPKRWTRVADAMASGLDYEDIGVLDLLIEASGDEQEAALEIHAMLAVDGKDYAPARMTVRGKAYRNTIGVLLRDKNAWLKGFFKNGKYTLIPEKKSNDKGSWFVPLLKSSGPTGEELKAAISVQFGL